MKLRQKKLWVSLVCLLSLVCLVGSASATNVVVNGDFEAGYTGFTSDYTIQPPGDIHAQGVYVVGSDPNLFHSSWGSFPAYGGSGNMMIVNGASALEKVWFQTVDVLPSTQYFFSAYVASGYHVSPAILDFSINGVTIGSPITASLTVGQWDLFYANWTSPASPTTADLALVNHNYEFTGNDFCIDNIKMDTVSPVPLPSTVLLLGSGLVGLGLLRRKWGMKK